MRNDLDKKECLDLNDQLLDVGQKVLAYIMGAPDPDPPLRILTGFARKAVNSLGAIQLLAKNGFWEEAQAITRIIFELRATFGCFWEMLKADPEKACTRVFDAMMLEKFKQIRVVDKPDFPDPAQRPDWDAAMKVIEGRYGEQELKAIKKNGFTGLSVEERCKTTGLQHVYDIMYRNLSRNIHSTDFVEQVGEAALPGVDFGNYRLVRDYTVLYIANYSAGEILFRADIHGKWEADFRRLIAANKSLAAKLQGNS